MARERQGGNLGADASEQGGRRRGRSSGSRRGVGRRQRGVAARLAPARASWEEGEGRRRPALRRPAAVAGVAARVVRERLREWGLGGRACGAIG
jgi:hypothetical protein